MISGAEKERRRPRAHRDHRAGQPPVSKAAPAPKGPAGERPSRSIPFALLALAFLGALAWSNSFRVPFLFDDLASIPDNPTIRSLSAALVPPPETTVYGRPVLNLSFALNYALSGLEVWSYHLVNLLIHLGAGLALFDVVRRTLLTVPLRERFAGVSLPLAATVSALWLVHPVHTESVTYIVQRAEALVGLFYLLTFSCYLRAAASPSPLWSVLAVGCCALGMGSKEVMATAPFLVLLHDRIFLAGSFREALRLRRRLYGGLFATLLIVLALAAKGRPGSAGFGEGMAWHEYARTQPGVILHYLRLSLLPWPLVFDYLWPVAGGAGVVLPSLILLLLAGAAIVLLRRNHPAAFPAAWFFLILAPTSSVIPIVTEVAAEHRLYLPLAAVSALVVLGGYHLLRERRGPAPHAAGKGLWAAAGVIALCLAALTFLRNSDYRSSVAIWTDTVEKRPANVRAQYNLAKALEEEGRLEEAVRRYSADVLRLKPDYAEAHASLGLTLARMGRLDEAMTHYQAALRSKPQLAEAHNNMALALVRQGRTPEALEHYAEAVRLKPAYAEAHYNRGNALAGSGAREEALASYAEALRLNPDLAAAHVNMAVCLEQLARSDDAARHYGEAIRLKPDYVKAHLSLGLLCARQGDREKARRHLETALRYQPDLPPARQALEQLARP